MFIPEIPVFIDKLDFCVVLGHKISNAPGGTDALAHDAFLNAAQEQVWRDNGGNVIVRIGFAEILGTGRDDQCHEHDSYKFHLFHILFLTIYVLTRVLH